MKLKKALCQKLRNMNNVKKFKIALVDVDNILWRFDEQLYKLIIDEGHTNMPHYSEWNEWHFYRNYISDEVFNGLIDKIHSKQHLFLPFKRSRVLSELLYKDYILYIVSIRSNWYRKQLVDFLDKWGIMYDDVYCFELGTNKINSFSHVDLLIDDSPKNIEDAINAGVKCVGIEYPYNQHLKDKVTLFKSMDAMYSYFYFKYLFTKGGKNWH